MKALDPKIRRCERFGFCPFHFSNGDEVDLFDGIIFRMYVEYATVSAQRLGGNLLLLAYSIDLAISTSVLFSRSATPFCCGVYGALFSWMIPSSVNLLLCVALTYSVALPDFKILILDLVWVSILARNASSKESSSSQREVGHWATVVGVNSVSTCLGNVGTGVVVGSSVHFSLGTPEALVDDLLTCFPFFLCDL